MDSFAPEETVIEPSIEPSLARNRDPRYFQGSIRESPHEDRKPSGIRGRQGKRASSARTPVVGISLAPSSWK